MKTFREFVRLRDGLTLPARPTRSVINPFPAMRAVLNPFKPTTRPAAPALKRLRAS
jgi:hypothetical protein